MVKKVIKWVCKVCSEKQSVTKVYAKGSGADCRKHVQTLNKMRGIADEKQRSELLNHPPQEYASTFDKSQALPTGSDLPEHSVVMVATKSKWTSFIEPQDSEEDSETNPERLYTMDKETFKNSHAKKKVRRSSSDRGPHPLTKAERATLPIPPKARETIYPYSAVSKDMELLLDGQTARITSAKSCYSLNVSERYRKLDEDQSNDYNTPQPLSQALQNILPPPTTTSTSAGATPHKTHQDHMASIHRDISRYSKSEFPEHAAVSSEALQTEQKNKKEKKASTDIPKASSKWSQFMCEESESEEEEEGRLGGANGYISSTHMLASRSVVAKYTLAQENSS